MKDYKMNKIIEGNIIINVFKYLDIRSRYKLSIGLGKEIYKIFKKYKHDDIIEIKYKDSYLIKKFPQYKFHCEISSKDFNKGILSNRGLKKIRNIYSLKIKKGVSLIQCLKTHTNILCTDLSKLGRIKRLDLSDTLINLNCTNTGIYKYSYGLMNLLVNNKLEYLNLNNIGCSFINIKLRLLIKKRVKTYIFNNYKFNNNFNIIDPISEYYYNSSYNSNRYRHYYISSSDEE